MGCAKSKVAVDVQPVSTDPPEPTPTDNRLPLNARQVFKLQKSWKGIRRNMSQTGVELFISLFKRNGHLKNMFKNFRHLETADEMRENETLTMHGVMVMSAVDDLITDINNVDNIIQQCEQLRESHSYFTGFDVGYFWFLEEPFLEAVKITLADACTDQMTEIYTLALHFLLQNMSGDTKDSFMNRVTVLNGNLNKG